MRKSLKYILVLIPLVFLTGCFNNVIPKKAEMRLTITPDVIQIGVYQDMRLTLKEANGVGVNLNRLEFRTWDKWGNLWEERIPTGTELLGHWRELFGTTYLAGNSTLTKTFKLVVAEPEGKREIVMGGTDNNGYSVKAKCEYWARP